MFGPRITQLVALLCCAGLLYGSAAWIPRINEGRKVLNVWGHESPIENAPPEYAFAIQALGAFRGLITDIAFIRAERLKEEGRYYDAMQLAKWICTLQPHFPSVWEFLSWNMAWNISVTTFTPEERWNWVYNGAKLLRDQGIPFNPGAINLYKQLAWTFNNKMSQTTDDFHNAYKCQWAWRMHLLLGPPPNPLSELNPEDLADQVESTEQINVLAEAARLTYEQNVERKRKAAEERGEEFAPWEVDDPEKQTPAVLDKPEYRLAQQAAYERIAAIDEAPASLAELIARHPEARDMLTQLRKLGIDINDDELTEDDYWCPGGLAFTFFKPYRTLVNPRSTLTSLLSGAPETGVWQEDAKAIGEILGFDEDNQAGQELVRFLQRKVLKEVYKLETEYMLELITEFGPMDWRSVDSQSLYWTTKGLIAGGETLNDFRNDKTNTARIIFFSLRNLFLFNRMTFEPLPGQIHRSYLNRGIDPAFIEPLHQTYIKYGRLFDPNPRGVDGAGRTYRAGHMNFLGEIIRRLYLSGYEAEAAYYYSYLQESYPTNEAGQPNPAVAKTLHDYVMDGYLDTAEVPGAREISLIIDALLSNAYAQLARNDISRYARLVRQSQRFHESYMSDKQDAGSRRMRIPDFIDMQVDTFMAWLARPPSTPWITLTKVRLWHRAPLFLRQSAYDRLLPGFEAECEAWQFELAQAFPEPPGMKEYRERHPDRYQQEREGAVETIPDTLSQ